MGFDYAGKVRALLAKADSAEKLGSNDEAETYRNTAFRIMRDYQIAEEEAIAVDPTAAVPTHRIIEVTVTDWEVQGHLPIMLRLIANHTGTKVRVAHSARGYHVTLVGYEGDIRYAEFLWTSAYLMFSTRISPTWDADRSEAENIFYLRNAGIQRREIAQRAWGTGDVAAARSKVQRIYIAEAKRRNEPVLAAGLGFDTRTYRQAYADSFVETLGKRLRIARDAADSTGGGLVLHGRADRVQAAYEELFPPVTATVAEYKDPTKECVKCQKAATTCNDHKAWRVRTWTQQDELRERRRTESTSARAGRVSGRTAAEGVALRGDHTKAQRLDASGRAIES